MRLYQFIIYSDVTDNQYLKHGFNGYYPVLVSVLIDVKVHITHLISSFYRTLT